MAFRLPCQDDPELMFSVDPRDETPAEAEALRDKAYALMTKYAIDQAEIDARRAASGGARIVEKIVERSVDITGIFRFGLLEVVHNVTMAFESVNAYMIKDFRVKV